MPRSDARLSRSDIARRLAVWGETKEGRTTKEEPAKKDEKKKRRWDFAKALKMIGACVNTPEKRLRAEDEMEQICIICSIQMMADSQEAPGRLIEAFAHARRVARKHPDARFDELFRELGKHLPPRILQELAQEMMRGGRTIEGGVGRLAAEAAVRCARRLRIYHQDERKPRLMARGRRSSTALPRAVQQLDAFAKNTGVMSETVRVAFIHAVLSAAGIPHPNPERDQSPSEFAKLLKRH